MQTTDTLLPRPNEIASALRARRARMLDLFTGTEGALSTGVVVVPAGLQIGVLGTDDVYRFRAHDDHLWLSGSRAQRGVLVCDPQGDTGDGAFTLYAYVPDVADRVWHGDGVPLENVAEQTGLARVRPLADLEGALAQLGHRPIALIGNLDLLERPGGYGLSASAIDTLSFDADLSVRIEQLVHAGRRVKDGVELQCMRAAAHATCAGHVEAMRLARPGMTELELRVELEATFFRNGGETVAYGSLVASGIGSAILHMAPSARAIGDGELILIDAGAETRAYDCDLTRTFPASGTYTAEQRAVYDIVLDVQQRAVAGARAGVEYRDLHLEACRGIARGLVDLGLLKGDPDGLVERDAHAIFFPHGLGHQIGLSTHDVGGYLEGRTRSERPGLKFLRMDLPLAAGHCVTIEPGIYFIEALIRDPDTRERHRDDVDFAMADRLLSFGGIRIEDTIHITDGEPEVLTAAVPKSLDDVEAACSA